MLKYFSKSIFIHNNLAHIIRFNGSQSSTMRVLNVAEKNDAAKNIAALLSGGRSRMREGFSKFNKIYEFDYHIFGQNCQMIMTSVAGHLMGYDFTALHRGWKTCNPSQLFEAPVVKSCPQDYQNIKRTLEREIRTCNKLIIWTDCDREGENIGYEIIDVCTAVKPNVDVLRAKFSEITQQSVSRAVRTLGPPNKNVSDAVEVRQELDLRIGAAFTRFQTLRLKQAFPDALGDNLISYGSCQFPTLGFVVERFKAIADFIPEQFWKIKVTHTKDGLSVEFAWKRVRLFDQLACEVIYDICRENPQATVTRIETKPKKKWRPRPLDTVELEKLASRKLRINAKETMRIAERLYTQGYISYPRTETNIFPKELDLLPLVQNQVEDPNWGEFANRVAQEGPDPFQGNKSDQAHPPIHPTKYARGLAGNEQKIYEFIVRHFLACLSKHAEGMETAVEIDIADEKFTAKGLMIIAKNYLEVYPYEKWSEKEIHIYQRGETFVGDIEMVESETSPPDLLTEADLIALMEKHGIGTDATHAEHIETIKARLYVGLKDDQYFVPRTLGMGLVEGYDSMGFDMSKPNLRSELEADLKRICDGEKAAPLVLAEQIRKYKEVFEIAQRQAERLDAAIQNCLNVQAQPVGEQHYENAVTKVLKCRRCGLDMTLRSKKDNSGKFVGCVGYPTCREAIWFNDTVEDLTVLNETCPTCGPTTHVIKFKLKRGVPLPPVYTSCIGGCDQILFEVLNISTRPHLNAPLPPPVPVAPRNPFPEPDRGSSRSSFDSGISSQNSSVRSRTNDDSGDVKCNCGTKAVRLTTRKPGPNLGRQFYKCDSNINNRDCNFFKWADEESSSGNTVSNTFTMTGASQYANRDDNRRPNVPHNDDNVNCYCAIPCRRSVVVKDGPNKGRSFYACSKPFGNPDKCNFFSWADEDSNNDSRGPPRNANWNQNRDPPQSQGNKRPFSQRNAGTQAKKRKCGLCGGEGHNRKNCNQ